MPHLEIQKSGRSRVTFTLLHFPFTIGRSVENDLVLDGETVSNSHAIIEKHATDYVFRDQSRNGSYIDSNLLRTSAYTLSNEHEIEIGAWRLKFYPHEINQGEHTITVEKNVAKIDDNKTRLIRLENSSNKIRGLRPVIYIFEKDQPKRLYYMRKRQALVGSGSHCDIVLNDPYISREHIDLNICGDGLRVRDLDSRNGTLCEDIKIREMILRENRRLTVGQTELEFHLVEEERCIIEPIKEKNFGNMIGGSEVMRNLFAKIKLVAATEMTVLITGETGTGKEMVAQAIHENSPRHSHRFAVINCAAIPHGLLESELFGCERGAFTGADHRRAGAFEWASGGTLFLDEIGELPLEMQAKILRTLEYQTIRRLGGTEEIQIDTRLIAATHRNLPKMIASGTFRQDLYYRLHIVPITLPALRERIEDIEDLAHHFLKIYSPQARFSSSSLEKLKNHSWPGNIRELKNCVQRTTAFCKDAVIEADQIQFDEIFLADQPPTISTSEKQHKVLKEFDLIEKKRIEEALQLHSGDKEATAQHLGMARSTLYRRMYELSITAPRKKKNWHAFYKIKD